MSETTDQAYDTNLHQDPQKSIRKGFVWIGLASALAQILNAVSMLALMMFLTKEELGIATIAVAASAIFEALQACGTGQAFLQSKTMTQNETHSLFWFAAMFGVGGYLLLLPISHILSEIYALPALFPMLAFAMLKLPAASIGIIPLQLVNRRFEFHKISIYQALTSVFCSCLKIGLAALGFGPWAFVIGDTGNAFGVLFFGFYFSKYRPKRYFSWQECKHFAAYGVRSSFSDFLDQITKNIHYLVIGKFIGEGFLGIYRVAYELAMTPALALFNVVAKSSFPVFARLQDNRPELSRLFAWNQRNLAVFAAIPSMAIFFCAPDIFGLFSNPDWKAGTPLIPFILAIAFVKSQRQTYHDLYRACGKPAWPILFQLIEAGGVFFLGSACLYFLPRSVGLYAMMTTWFAILLLFIFAHRKLAFNFVDTSFRQIGRNLSHAFGYMIAAGALSAVPYIYRDALWFAPFSHIAAEAVIILAVLWGYTRFVLKVRLVDFLKRKR